MARRHGKDFEYVTYHSEAAGVEQPAMAFAKKAGWTERKLKWGDRGDAPDRFLIRRGRIILIEFKAEDGSLSKGQKIEFEELRAAGAEVFVVDNLEDAYEILA